jgi:hypothetical protein
VGEGPWDLWEARDSLLQRVTQGRTARLEGTGTLELEVDAQESGAPTGPGRVQFALQCDFEELRLPYAQALQVRLVSQDDVALKIIRGRDNPKFIPLPSYRLSGTISTAQGQVPVRMDGLAVDAGGLTAASITDEKSEIRRVVPVHNVTVGSLKSVSDLVSCKVLVPNFSDEATVEHGGVRVTIKEVSPEATDHLFAPESQGKVLPGSYLEVERLTEHADDGFELAVNDFGWLLSFYAGRRIQPIAWEGETSQGTVWRILADQLITPLSESHAESCVSSVVPLHHFLQHAWKAWQDHDDRRRARLRGAVNFYADVLATTFATQKLAFTTMYLERFRDMLIGSSTLLEEINEDEKRLDASLLAKKARRILRTTVEHNESLSEEEKHRLVKAVNKVGPGQVNGLFRKTFRESLLEIFDKADLQVDHQELSRFIAERDRIVHGSWDSGREGTLRTYRLAEYGLNLFEMILLRLFEYQGKYRNRAKASRDIFHPGTPNWQKK